jgi:hypothetical protein
MRKREIEMFLCSERKSQINGELHKYPKSPLKNGLITSMQIQSEKFHDLSMMSPIEGRPHRHEN